MVKVQFKTEYVARNSISISIVIFSQFAIKSHWKIIRFSLALPAEGNWFWQLHRRWTKFLHHMGALRAWKIPLLSE